MQEQDRWLWKCRQLAGSHCPASDSTAGTRSLHPMCHSAPHSSKGAPSCQHIHQQAPVHWASSCVAAGKSSPSPPADLVSWAWPGQEGAPSASSAHCKTAETLNPTSQPWAWSRPWLIPWSVPGSYHTSGTSQCPTGVPCTWSAKVRVTPKCTCTCFFNEGTTD